jgi:hypothetical protein
MYASVLSSDPRKFARECTQELTETSTNASTESSTVEVNFYGAGCQLSAQQSLCSTGALHSVTLTLPAYWSSSGLRPETPWSLPSPVAGVRQLLAPEQSGPPCRHSRISEARKNCTFFGSWGAHSNLPFTSRVGCRILRLAQDKNRSSIELPAAGQNRPEGPII